MVKFIFNNTKVIPLISVIFYVQSKNFNPCNYFISYDTHSGSIILTFMTCVCDFL